MMRMRLWLVTPGKGIKPIRILPHNGEDDGPDCA